MLRVKIMKPIFTLSFIFLAFRCNTAYSCSMAGDSLTDEQLFQKATSIFVGHIFRTEEKLLSVESKTFLGVEGEFRDVETLKDQCA